MEKNLKAGMMRKGFREEVEERARIVETSGMDYNEINTSNEEEFIKAMKRKKLLKKRQLEKEAEEKRKKKDDEKTVVGDGKKIQPAFQFMFVFQILLLNLVWKLFLLV